MKRSLSLSRVLAGFLVLAGIALVLRFAIASLPQSPGATPLGATPPSLALHNPASQETLPGYPPPWVDSSGKAYTEPAYPPPPEGYIVLTRAPTDTPEPLPLITPTPRPTETHYPTYTPYPSSTLRPGPTDTPVPLLPAARDASGSLHYLAGESSERIAVYSLAMDAAGRAENPATNISGEMDLTDLNAYPAPDGSRIAFYGDWCAEYILYLDTGTFERMFSETFNECGTYASWHPDNRHILVIAKERLPGLLMIDTDTWEFTPLAVPGLGTIVSGAVSPDGHAVIYSYSWGFPNPAEIWIVNAHGREERYLFTLPLSPDYFVWSPDGRQILFFMNNLRVIDDQGNDLYSLDLGDPSCTPRHYPPLMSPDGRYMAIQQDLSDEPYIHPWSKEAFAETSICLFDLASGETRSLIPGETQGVMHPTWSPDGSQIAFVSNRSGSSEIWTINVDGSNLRQVTFGGVDVRFPQWLRP